MSKYKIGDKVKVRGDLDIGHHGVIDSMLKYKGDEVTIERIYPNGEHIEYRFEEIGYTWTDECIVELVEEAKPVFKIGDKVEIISIDQYDKAYNLKVGDRGIVSELIDRSCCGVTFSSVLGKILYYEQIKLVDEDFVEEPSPTPKSHFIPKTKETKPKYVKCITSEFRNIKKDEVYEVLKEYYDEYVLEQGNYSKRYFVEVDSPIEPTQSIPKKGTIKYRTTDDGITYATLNGSKTGKSVKSGKDEADNKIGILIATCRLLNIGKDKIQNIIDVLFDNDSCDSKAKCENAVMKNDIARALSILDKYKEVE